jgi:two-component system, LytTR family, response regulator AlgR
MTQTKLTILIADDELPAINRLKELCADLDYVTVIGEASNGSEVVSLVDSLHPNVVLLDIRMPVMDGIEAAEHLQALVSPPAIIFTTAYDHYAIKAFDLNAIDYLLKPIRQERLALALKKVSALKPSQLVSLKTIGPQKQYLSITERGRILLVPITDVIYCRAELKYITVRTATREYLLEASLNQLELEYQDMFLRLHRNCLVATSHIMGYEKRNIAGDDSEKQWVALLKGVPETITVSRRQQHLIKQFY